MGEYNKNACSEKKKEVFGWIKSFFIGFVIFALFSLFFKVINVNGNSMNDTYFDGDMAIIYRHSTPQKGDVVVCNSSGVGKNLIKRVIAVGGDEIDIDFESGTITLNGEILYEDYIKEPTTTDEGGFEYPVTVPDGHIFVMGDNRNHSTDSRDARVGFVPLEDVEGKVLFKIPI